jgi:hypothetical protein
VARIVALTVERRNEKDDDLEEAEALQDAFDEDLRQDTLPDETIFWTAGKMAEVVNRALHSDLTTRKVSHFLKAHLEAGRLPRVTKYRTAAQKGWHLKRPPPPEDDNPLPPLGASPAAPAPATENAP